MKISCKTCKYDKGNGTCTDPTNEICDPDVYEFWEPKQTQKDPKSLCYDANEIESSDIIKANLTTEQYQGFLLGNIIRYSCRVDSKNMLNKEDLEKTVTYAKLLSNISAK